MDADLAGALTMQHGWPALYTLLLWWFSTGVILYLNGLPRATCRDSGAIPQLVDG